MASITKPLVVYLPDTRGVEISPYGIGNLKIGIGVHTYSRPAGRPQFDASEDPTINTGGTCPGSTEECESICYAKRIAGVVRMIYDGNTESEVPPIPEECKILRIHVSGDFDSLDYIASWYRRLKERPDVTAWCYTRSWRVPALLTALEHLRRLPNLQLFASMDASCKELPPEGWRRAWIHRTVPKNGWGLETRLDVSRTPISVGGGEYRMGDLMTRCNVDGVPSYVCPEETKRKPNCLSCGYCFEGQKNDVTFLEH